jgi:hypothetical protein
MGATPILLFEIEEFWETCGRSEFWSSLPESNHKESKWSSLIVP